jgi:folate-binding protein YgfZ
MTSVGASPPPVAEGFLDDYAVLRQGVGVVSVPRDVVRVSGPDAVSYLQGQCTQDVNTVAVGSSVDALLLTPQGKLDALVRISRTGDDEIYVDVDAGFGEAVVARLGRFKLRVKADIEQVPWRNVALRGPDAPALLDGLASAGGTSIVAPYAWGGVTGFDLLGPGPEIPTSIRRCGDEAWEAVRIEAGIPFMGAELDERTIAAEADLLERCVSFTKGCYTGQELVARLDARGNKVARRLRAVAVDPGQGEGWVLRPGATVSTADKSVGRLTSVAWAPGLGTPVALSYLHRDVEPPLAVRVAVDDSNDTTITARALSLPLEV